MGRRVGRGEAGDLASPSGGIREKAEGAGKGAALWQAPGNLSGRDATGGDGDPATLPLVPETLDLLISRDQIAARVDELAGQIDADYAAVDELVLIGVLKGSFIFLADLARHLSIPHRVEFIAISSYGDRESTESGAVRMLMDVRHDIGGCHVLMVEDIIDTGHTLAYLLRLLGARSPASLKACTLLRKPDRLQVDVPIAYLGFDIDDVWVVGYGLDFAERHRTLPDICSVRQGER
jgi:hypoxanthine phosphoribosyltransferase